MKKVLVTAKDHSLMELLYHQIQLHSTITKFIKKKNCTKNPEYLGLHSSITKFSNALLNQKPRIFGGGLNV